MDLLVTHDHEQIQGSFDAVFIWNTFDQLANPSGMLRMVRDRLYEKGILVLRVPNGVFETRALERMRQGNTERARMAMAYNNFLTFPYLTGYTPSSLTTLLGQHGFTVNEIIGDTILPLANESTRDFAVREEQRYKRAVMRACELAPGECACPWIDVVASLSHKTPQS
jgi:hypothetical protein